MGRNAHHLGAAHTFSAHLHLFVSVIIIRIAVCYHKALWQIHVNVAFGVIRNVRIEVTTFTPQIVLYTAVGIGTLEWLIGVIFRARFHPRLVGLHIADLIVPF